MNTETVRKELPEGWEAVDDFYHRTADAAEVIKGKYGWCAYESDYFINWESSALLNKPFPTAIAAMEALDREYPMEKQHGKK